MTTQQAETTGFLSEIFASYQGEGRYVGRRHLFLRLAGCHVGCRYCDTPDALRPGQGFEVRTPGVDEPGFHSNPVTAKRTALLVQGLLDSHGPFHSVSITGGEPLEQPEFLREILRGLEGAHILLETAGVHPDELRSVIDGVNTISMDLKIASVTGTDSFSEAHRRFLQIALQKDVYVKVVVGNEMDVDQFADGARLVSAEDADITFFVQPETDRKGLPCVKADELTNLADIARASGLRDVRVLPQVHRYLEVP